MIRLSLDLGLDHRQTFVARSKNPELAARRAAFRAPPPGYEHGYGWMFSRHIKQADEGCDFDFLETAFGRAAAEADINWRTGWRALCP